MYLVTVTSKVKDGAGIFVLSHFRLSHRFGERD